MFGIVVVLLPSLHKLCSEGGLCTGPFAKEWCMWRYNTSWAEVPASASSYCFFLCCMRFCRLRAGSFLLLGPIHFFFLFFKYLRKKHELFSKKQRSYQLEEAFLLHLPPPTSAHLFNLQQYTHKKKKKEIPPSPDSAYYAFDIKKRTCLYKLGIEFGLCRLDLQPLPPG